MPKRKVSKKPLPRIGNILCPEKYFIFAKNSKIMLINANGVIIKFALKEALKSRLSTMQIAIINIEIRKITLVEG